MSYSNTQIFVSSAIFAKVLSKNTLIITLSTIFVKFLPIRRLLEYRNFRIILKEIHAIPEEVPGQVPRPSS